ncbi:unnamed protein product [Clonostachys solani]|uniref:Uncharacterized protein n=1 Tax=Clonostachys solani TaxID=160281 RepID=A0A9N9ZJV9_9HYPO|nr:unnamed protein product [Clonostachys solani]
MPSSVPTLHRMNGAAIWDTSVVSTWISAAAGDYKVSPWCENPQIATRAKDHLALTSHDDSKVSSILLHYHVQL